MNGLVEKPQGMTEESLAALRENLLRLRSSDAGERVDAFNHLGPLPPEWLDFGYENFRRVTPAPGYQLDCLERLEVEVPREPITCERCVCAVISPGYEAMLEAMLETLERFGESSEARIVVFAVDSSYDALAHRKDITPIRCRSVERLSPAVKGAIYSAAQFIHAKTIVALETDTLVVGSLRPLWAALDSVEPASLMGVRPDSQRDMTQVLAGMGAPPVDMEFLTGQPDFDCPHWFNGGVLAGGREAFLRLERQMRRLCPRALLWLDGGSTAAYIDEFLMNLCLGLDGSPVYLRSAFNQQCYTNERERWLQTAPNSDPLCFLAEGEPSRILHFVSGSRPLLWQIKTEIDRQNRD